MPTTVIFAHPYKGSFNRAILDTVLDTLASKDKSYDLIDLYADKFDPVLNEEDLFLYASGETHDPLVKKYNEILDVTDELVLIFPIWWYDFPAIMKGFFDRVMLEGSAFHEDEAGMHPVRSVGRTLLFTTSSAPTEALIDSFGDTVNRMMIDSTFKAIGWGGCHWENLGTIGASTTAQREAFLVKVASLVCEG